MMQTDRSKYRFVGNRLAILAATFALPAAVLAAPVNYTDTHGDQVGSTNKARDIWSVSVDNDASNFIITINLDPGATLGTVTFDYGIGITTGAGANGDLSTNATTHGNAYSRTISIDSSLGGMIDWVGLFPAGGAGTVASPWTTYGYNAYSWAPSVWTKNNQNLSIFPMATQSGQTGLSSITATIPFTDFPNLSLVPGATIQFDVYSTGTAAGQTAYDSLVASAPTNNTNSATTQYNGTALASYTIQSVPEASSLMAGIPLLLAARRRSRR